LRQKDPGTPRYESAPEFTFLSCPRRQIRARKAVSETVRGSFQVPFFHQNEIMALDIGIVPKLPENGAKPTILRLFRCLTISRIAEFAAFF
jgi:hypothetical protein